MKRRRGSLKADPTTPPASKIATSPGTGLPGRLRRSSKRGNHSTPAKPSRLLPSGPFSMTTRRAASNATNSRAGSVASATSPIQHDAPFDSEGERAAKRPRVSTEANSPPTQIPSPARSSQDAPSSKSASRASSHASRTSSKRARNSDASNANGATNGIHLTKVERDPFEKRPALARRQKRAKVASNETPLDSTEIAPAVSDEASTASRSPEPSLENPITQAFQNALPAASQEPAKVPKRLPGRRRQPHADVSIEADLRRQLQLKTAYRAMVKALKPVLGELAQRTLTGLENDPEFHKQSDDYPVVCRELLARKQQRLAVLDNKRRLAIEESERVQAAEEHIQREQFAIQVQNLKEDFLLQCRHRLLQLERESKGLDGTGTDDEDAVVVPRHGAQYPYKSTGPLPAKSDSRSRAYIETEEMWKQAEVRFDLDKARKAFVEQNPDSDDAIGNLPGGFAAYAGLSGTDREFATASYNVDTLADAAMQLEQTAAEKAKIKVIPNEEATALLMLATASTEIPPGTPPTRTEQLNPVAPAPMSTPARKTGNIPPASPYGPPSATSTAMSLDTLESSPVLQSEQLPGSSHPTPRPEVNNIPPVAQEIVRSDPPAKSSNKIMDLLNDDTEDSNANSRAYMKPAALTYDGATTSNPAINGPSQGPNHGQVVDLTQPGPLNGTSRNDQQTERVSEQRYSQAPERKPAPYEPIRPREKSPPHGFWSNDTMTRRRNSKQPTPDRTLIRIKQMLDSSSRQQAPDKTVERAGSESTSDTSNARRGSIDKTHMGPPPTRVSIPHERTGSGSRHPSSSHSAQSPSSGHFTFSQSPSDQQSPHVHRGPQNRPNSTDHGYRPPWEDGRRASAPQQHPPPISPYGPPPQGYPPDYNGQARAPPQSGPQLPPFVQTAQIPPPYTYRFAHYDSQGPPQSQYPTPVSSSYGPPPPPPQPPTHQSPYPPQPPPQHNPPYSGPPSFNMYQPHQPHQPYQPHPPPPHQQQQPPPPPSPYPPTKYAGSQYGGQPILPANMDPRNSQSVPPQAYGQPPHPPAFSQQPPHKPQYEHTTGPNPPPAQEYPKRRPRNFGLVPGSEFKAYTGPNQKRRP